MLFLLLFPVTFFELEAYKLTRVLAVTRVKLSSHPKEDVFERIQGEPL